MASYLANLEWRKHNNKIWQIIVRPPSPPQPCMPLAELLATPGCIRPVSCYLAFQDLRYSGCVQICIASSGRGRVCITWSALGDNRRFRVIYCHHQRCCHLPPPERLVLCRSGLRHETPGLPCTTRVEDRGSRYAPGLPKAGWCGAALPGPEQGCTSPALVGPKISRRLSWHLTPADCSDEVPAGNSVLRFALVQALCLWRGEPGCHHSLLTGHRFLSQCFWCLS